MKLSETSLQLKIIEEETTSMWDHFEEGKVNNILFMYLHWKPVRKVICPTSATALIHNSTSVIYRNILNRRKGYFSDFKTTTYWKLIEKILPWAWWHYSASIGAATFLKIFQCIYLSILIPVVGRCIRDQYYL